MEKQELFFGNDEFQSRDRAYRPSDISMRGRLNVIGECFNPAIGLTGLLTHKPFMINWLAFASFNPAIGLTGLLTEVRTLAEARDTPGFNPAIGLTGLLTL